MSECERKKRAVLKRYQRHEFTAVFNRFIHHNIASGNKRSCHVIVTASSGNAHHSSILLPGSKFETSPEKTRHGSVILTRSFERKIKIGSPLTKTGYDKKSENAYGESSMIPLKEVNMRSNKQTIPLTDNSVQIFMIFYICRTVM